MTKEKLVELQEMIRNLASQHAEAAQALREHCSHPTPKSFFTRFQLAPVTYYICPDCGKQEKKGYGGFPAGIRPEMDHQLSEQITHAELIEIRKRFNVV
jgi:hypothetical protein